MTHKLHPIIFIISFALLIQNTCPVGAAGKTSLASLCQNCPLKHSIVVSPVDQKELVSNTSSMPFPIHVFSVPETLHALQHEPMTSLKQILHNGHGDDLPHEILRPPRT